jgi:uncharacterized protein (TIGR02147 family)
MAAPAAKPTQNLIRPDVFSYQDYKHFLRDYFHYRKLKDPEFSTRALATAAQISNGYLSTILNTSQQITEKALNKILPELGLLQTEESYLRLLCRISQVADHQDRADAVRKIKRYKKFAKLNPKESLVLNYFSKWYTPAIREMASLPEFQPNPKWIQENLSFMVPLSEIAKALEFLFEHKLIRFRADGRFESSGERIECEGNIHRLVLTQAYQQIFDLAGDSIDNIEREKRNLRAHMVSLSDESFAKARTIMDDALESIAKLDTQGAAEQTYQFLLLGFPLSNVKRGKS